MADWHGASCRLLWTKVLTEKTVKFVRRHGLLKDYFLVIISWELRLIDRKHRHENTQLISAKEGADRMKIHCDSDGLSRCVEAVFHFARLNGNQQISSAEKKTRWRSPTVVTTLQSGNCLLLQLETVISLWWFLILSWYNRGLKPFHIRGKPKCDAASEQEQQETEEVGLFTCTTTA